MPEREATRNWRTDETSVEVSVHLDQREPARISTGLPFLDHLLESFARCARFSLLVSVSVQREVDEHHVLEDVAIGVGETLSVALGDRRGIYRYGEAAVTLDESLAHVALDCSGRGFAVISLPLVGPTIGTVPTMLIPHFVDSFAIRAGVTLHATTVGEDDHHMAEATFEALGVALGRACAIDPDFRGWPVSNMGELLPVAGSDS